MFLRILALTALATTGGFAAALDHAPAPAGNVTVELPSGLDVYPGGKEAAAINNNCLACHSAEMVLTQPKLSKATWESEVTKMRKVYGAPLVDEDIPAIVDYLANLQPGK